MQYVYLVRAGANHYKVGIATNVRSRVAILQPHNPELIEIITTKYADTNAYQIEQELHKSLEHMKAKGANEWFVLTPEQALELAIVINKYPDIDISERVTLSELVHNQKRMQKQIDKKLDYVINTYQRFKPQLPKEVAKKVEAPTPKKKENNDEYMYNQAVQVAKNEGEVSTSMLQRELRIGYGRAYRIMHELEQAGVITKSDGSIKRRQLLI